MIRSLTPRSWRNRIASHSNGRFKTVDDFLVAASDAGDQLQPLTSRGPLGRCDVVLVTLIRNEARRLPSFLTHYRKLGVDRFIIIDNDSTDATAELLLSATDVDLWLARGPYKSGQLLWLTAMIHACASHHWVVNVDADEFLVYEGMDRHDLHALAAWMQRTAQRRLRAYMIDVFSDKPIRQTEWPAGNPLEADWFFDPRSYSISKNDVRGGPRYRLFSTTDAPFANALQKFPLLRFDPASVLTNIHFPYPYHLNNGRPFAALLHLKFTSDFISAVDRAVAENQHWRNSIEYRTYQKALCENPDLSLYNRECQLYEGPSSLIEAGLMEPIDWAQAAPKVSKGQFSRRHQIHASVRGIIGPKFAKLRPAATLS